MDSIVLGPAEEGSLELECLPVKKFWADLDSWCNNHIHISLANFTVAEKLLGFRSGAANKGKERLQNWMLLTLKYYIHREKLFNQGGLSLLGFLGEVRKRLHTERLAGQLEGKTGKFRKFNKLFHILGGHTVAPHMN